MTAKILPLWTFIVLCAFAHSQETGTFRYVQNSSGGVTITGYTGREKNLHIPAYIGGLPVIAIGNRAFRGMGLEAVEIPGGVRSIGVMAFADNGLERVELPEGLRIIETGAFASNRLESVSMPDSVTVVRYNAFGRNPVRDLSMSRNLRSVSPRVFTESRLRRISIGGNVEIYLGNFDGSFVNYYGSRERQGGNYEMRDGVWIIAE